MESTKPNGKSKAQNNQTNRQQTSYYWVGTGIKQLINILMKKLWVIAAISIIIMTYFIIVHVASLIFVFFFN